MLLSFSFIFTLLFVGTLSCMAKDERDKDYGINGYRLDWVSEIKSCNQGKLSQTKSYNLKSSLKDLKLTYENINQFDIIATMDQAVFDVGVPPMHNRKKHMYRHLRDYHFSYVKEQGSEKVFVCERKEITNKHAKEQHAYMRLTLFVPRTGPIRLENYVEAESWSDDCAYILVRVAMISITKKKYKASPA